MKEQRKQYRERAEVFQKDYFGLKKKISQVGVLRLVSFILACYLIYLGFSDNQIYTSILGALLLIGFFILVKYNSKLTFNRDLKKILEEVNNNELEALEQEKNFYENGQEYINPKHPFSYDLDLFGNNSLFHFLNRSATTVGKKSLANTLSNPFQEPNLKAKQEAIKELRDKLSFRQNLLANALINRDNHEIVNFIEKWGNSKPSKENPLLKVVAILSPIVLSALLIAYFVTWNNVFNQLALGCFLLNLGILGSQFKKFKSDLLQSTKIENILNNYGRLISIIEQEEFESNYLNNLKSNLNTNNLKASQALNKLGSLFGSLEQMANLFISSIVNGFTLYHIHVFRKMIFWKRTYGPQIKEWIVVIGEFEALNSLANFSYNNDDYCFPEINKTRPLSFQELGHPLLKKGSRINNDIEFGEQGFIILTGSNMSGKSTFLRSLGINMILAGTGGPICSKTANIHPLKVLVSMRVSDSLEDSESYFFAEVKRLKEIMKTSEEEECFLLLDEILRGTNSDDKQHGTIEVIKKLAQRNVVGAIATHDLEVCNTAKQFPNSLTNKCFEVDIINDELVFDYKLREGICKNKNATFLMEKMGVI